MDLDDLARHVGEERFRLACEWAWKTAADTGTRLGDDEWPEDIDFVPHELEDVVWDLDGTWSDRVALAFALYERMPCSANLMYTVHYIRVLDEPARTLFWTRFRMLLGHADDRLADPVAYSLWADHLEDADLVEEAWTRLTEPPLGRRGLERLLRVSGPVPWKLKAPLLRELARERRWHGAVLDALLGAAFDIYGQVDAKEARRLLARLDVHGRGEAGSNVAARLDELARPRPKGGR